MEAPVSGNYVFNSFTDDGVRLWIDCIQVIDDWTDSDLHMPAPNLSAAIPLVAGTKYDIRMEFYERFGSAVAVLSWE